MVVNQSSSNLDEKILKEEKGNFTCSAFSCVIYEQNIYTLEPSKVNVRTFQVDKLLDTIRNISKSVNICNFCFQGTVKQVLQFTENEGDPFLASINGTYLAVATTQGLVKVFDLSRR